MTDPIDALTYVDGQALARDLASSIPLDRAARHRVVARGADLVRRVRDLDDPGLMESFLAEYGLSTDEGVALMCLAEALLRVPDEETIDALIEDKIAPSDWGKHLGRSASSLVNASTWALMLTGRVLDDEEQEPGIAGALRQAVRRLGEPVIRTAVGRAMKEMGRQFVLGETMAGAMERAAGMEAKGFTYSYDMLGEAARTDKDALRYHLAYGRAIVAIAAAAKSDDIAQNPGISVKLSALHPRYEEGQRKRVLAELTPRLLSLATLAKSARIGLNVDAEEADRLMLSLDVMEAALSSPALAGWDGFGIVVQAYGQRAGAVIDRVYDMAQRLDRRLMVRLVKGAYWDTEIKRAQVLGLDGFPVFTEKAATDVSYLANAAKLLRMTDRIYPQFATHNAHTIAAILELAEDRNTFEFQRLHGMGEALHVMVMQDFGSRCRIYAPVGAHRDLLAYLVRRLLENGANSSFVNQIVDLDIPPEDVTSDPIDDMGDPPTIPTGEALFSPDRRNSKGFDLTHRPIITAIDAARAPFHHATWTARPLIAGAAAPEAPVAANNPFDPSESPGTVANASAADIEAALSAAAPWEATAAQRGEALNRAADLYETNYGELFALLAREAGKTPLDAVAELREAVDFLRYYASQATDAPPAGRFVCISPWNFPLAIFTGQIAGALAAGNAVLAKPAEATPLIAWRAVQLLHEAGIPESALQLLPGEGGTVGRALTSDARVDGVAFTGSTRTALMIRRAMADNLAPGAPLIAETGGLNCMIVDSTALPEQAVRAVVESAFQSAGQRCSALRCLYLQDDIAEGVLEMLKGGMEELRLGDPWDLATDCGPVISAEARAGILEHIAAARADGRVIAELQAPEDGYFVPPTIIGVNGVEDLEREVFGPVLHVATFEAEDLETVIDAVNATGYGLTFGLQTRIDDRVQLVADRVHAGNIYVNRNQIGAIVESQPFGGEGLSGTGPKAGGPHYLARFRKADAVQAGAWEGAMSAAALEAAIARAEPGAPRTVETMPGPTGESNRLATEAKPPLLCLGPGVGAAEEQANAIRALGGSAAVATGRVASELLETLNGFSGALFWGAPDEARAYARALANRDGPILPLITGMPDTAHARHERHISIDTTAAGGNAALLGSVAG